MEGQLYLSVSKFRQPFFCCNKQLPLVKPYFNKLEEFLHPLNEAHLQIVRRHPNTVHRAGHY